METRYGFQSPAHKQIAFSLDLFSMSRVGSQLNRIAKAKFSIPEELSLLKGFDITLQ